MKPLDKKVTDAELIGFIDRWVEHLEQEDYLSAYNHTDHNLDMGWTPELICEVIKSYSEGGPEQRVTLTGKPIAVQQVKEVTRWQLNEIGFFGEIWYDLNIDGYVSDLTATFNLRYEEDGVYVELNDIHVM